MAKLATVALRPGIHHAPQGPLHATPERMRAWVDKFRAMKADGIRVPCAWGHQPDALPGDAQQRAAQQYYLSRFNAGYIDDLDLDEQGNIRCKLDIPGCDLTPDGKLASWVRLPDGREVRTAIGEVSAGIRDWTDGRGRLWKDSLIHLALVPLPVMAGQDGFRALATQTGDIHYIGFTLATTGGPNMDPDKDRDEDTPEAPEPAPDEVGMDDLPASEPVAPDTGRLSEAIQVLEAHGLHLPPDTTAENLIERLCVAGHAKMKGSAEPNPEALPPENAAMEQPVDAERPVLMSLTTAKTDVERKVLAREQERHRKLLLARIDKLRRAGMPAYKADELTERLSAYTLSLDSDLNPVPGRTDLEIAIWYEALKALGGPKQRERLLSTASADAPRPDSRGPKDPTEEELEERAARVSTNMTHTRKK